MPPAVAGYYAVLAVLLFKNYILGSVENSFQYFICFKSKTSIDIFGTDKSEVNFGFIFFSGCYKYTNGSIIHRRSALCVASQ